jgi:uncharacterized protein
LKLFLTKVFVTFTLLLLTLHANTDERHRAYHEVYLLSLEAFERSSDKKEKAKAAWVLAQLYKDGKGVSANAKKSLKWYRIAGKYEHLKSMEYLMRYYFSVEKDVEKGIIWAYKAAVLGSDLAMSSIGLFYEQAESYETAASWYEKGFKAKGANSTYYLGLMYYNGHWYEKDKEKAKPYFEEAKRLGHKKAKLFLEKNYQ